MATLTIVERPIREQQLPRSDLDRLLQSDATLFPNSLTLGTLQSWYDANATNFLAYDIPDGQSSEETLGTLVAYPMKAKPWAQLINGELEEHAITSDMILPLSMSAWSSDDYDLGYGVHVWHIEKAEGWNKATRKSFKEVFWSSLQRSADGLASKGMNCIGFSALCASTEGVRAFSNLGFRLQRYCDSVFQNRAGECKIMDSTTADDEWKLLFKCAMYVKGNRD